MTKKQTNSKTSFFKKLTGILKISFIIVLLFIGYKAYQDFSNFIKHPLGWVVDAVKNLPEFIGYEEEVKLDYGLINEKLFKDQKIIFAKQEMTLKYNFYREKTSKAISWSGYKNFIRRNYKWTVFSNIGISDPKDYSIDYDNESKTLIFNINTIKAFEINHGHRETVKNEESKSWTDQEIPGSAWENDKFFVADEMLKKVLGSQEHITKLKTFAKESISEVVSNIICKMDDRVKVKVETNNAQIIYDYAITHQSSWYYKQDNGISIDILGESTDRVL